jgi:hypothetical protein
MKAVPELPSKRPYSTPRLSKYGDLAVVTAAASMNFTVMDGGPNSSKSN